MTVEIYTSPTCSFCDMAKQLLTEHHMAYIEKKLGVDFTREFILEHFPGQSAYPVIVIDGMNVGGYNGLRNYLTLMEMKPDPRHFLAEEYGTI
jgi:glutaredoxin 3